MGESFPTRPIHLIVPFPPGGVADLVARGLAAQMSKQLAQPVVIENRAGAAGNVGAAAVAVATPDGHTVLYAVGSILTANPHLYDPLPFDASRDFAAVGESVSGGMVLLARRNLPIETVADLIGHLKRNPAGLSYASYGIGTFPHLNMELIKSIAGVDAVHVPYRGAAPALGDLVAGRVDLMFDVSATAIPQVRGGKAKALAVNTPQRLAALPHVPALAETFSGFDGSGWQGLFVPAATPDAAVARLNRALNQALADPALRRRIVDSGLVPVGGPADQLARKVVAESRKWADVVRFANIRLD